MLTDCQDVDGSNDISWGRHPALAPENTVVLAPFAAYGTRLRRVFLINHNGTSQLVVKELDNLEATGLTYLLGLSSSQLRCRIVERLTYIAGSSWESVSDKPSCLMKDVLDAVLSLC